MFDDFRADVRRYRQLGGGRGVKGILRLACEQGVWAIAVYRFSRWCYAWHVPVASSCLHVVCFVLRKGVEITAGISIDPVDTVIGTGFYIGHFGQIIFGPCDIGEHFSIGPGCTVGSRGLGDTGRPRIGRNVYMGVGSKVLGGVTIGDNVVIGANAVVLTDLPSDCVAAGVPAQVVKHRVPQRARA